jgi:hypothetical protein
MKIVVFQWPCGTGHRLGSVARLLGDDDLHGLGDETAADAATEQVVVDPDLLRRQAGHLCGGCLGAACIAPAVVNAVFAATVGISKSRKSRAEIPPIASKSRRTQRRRVVTAMLRAHSLNVRATAEGSLKPSTAAVQITVSTRST